MAWTTPLTAVSNATLTAAQWNASVRDNLLETAPAKATAAGRLIVTTASGAIAERVVDATTVATAEATASTSYAVLATAGPAVTVTTGARAIVMLNAAISNSTLGQKSYVGCAVTGASSFSSSDSEALEFQVYGANAEFRGACTLAYETLTPGSNTFTMQYRVSGGTATYSNRVLTVIAL